MKLHGLQISVALLVCAASPVFAEKVQYWADGVTKTSGWWDIDQGQTNHCWAVTSSNLWAWYFREAQNKGYDFPAGVPSDPNAVWDWIKTKHSTTESGYIGANGLKEYIDGSGYFNDYKPVRVSRSGSTNGKNLSDAIYDALSQGVPVGISEYSTINTSQRHGITIWGIEYDTEKQALSKIYITDSSAPPTVDLSTYGEDYKGQITFDGLCTYDCIIDNAGGLEIKLNDEGKFSAYGISSSFGWHQVFGVDYLTWDFEDANDTLISKPIKDGYFGFSGANGGTISADANTGAESDGNRVQLYTESSTSDTGAVVKGTTFANIEFNRETKISKTDATGTTAEKLTAEFDGATREIYDAKIGASLTLENVSLSAKNSLTADGVSVFLTNSELRGGASGTLTGTFVAGTGTLGNMKISGGNLFAGNSPGLLTLDDATVSGGTLGFYAGSELADAIKNISGSVQITLGENGGMLGENGGMLGETAVTSGFKITAGTTLSGDITLTLWNVESTATTTGVVSRTFDENILTGIALTVGSSLQLFSLSDADALSGATFTLDETWSALLSDGLSWDASKLSSTGLLYVIPEPSAFGLLAGLGALALAISRRKRRK